MKWIFAIITVVFSFSATQAFADTFRCPNGNLVSTGDKISTVAAKCDPAASTVRRGWLRVSQGKMSRLDAWMRKSRPYQPHAPLGQPLCEELLHQLRGKLLICTVGGDDTGDRGNIGVTTCALRGRIRVT